VNGQIGGERENTVKKSLVRCRSEYFPQEKPKSSLLNEPLPGESHIKYELT